jgi:hypothetical protein
MSISSEREAETKQAGATEIGVLLLVVHRIRLCPDWPLGEIERALTVNEQSRKK